MSKILESIAELERVANTVALRHHVDTVAIATAARAEHAEIVAFVRRVSEISCRDSMYSAIEHAEDLLSRLAPERAE